MIRVFFCRFFPFSILRKFLYLRVNIACKGAVIVLEPDAELTIIENHKKNFLEF